MTRPAQTGGQTFTAAEMMIVASARQLAGERVCFVGVGLPNIACNLAQRTGSAALELVYESGVFGSRPARLPLSIGDPTLATAATAVTSMYELFAYYLQHGLIDVGFLGGAQVDRFGNINSTVIGDYAKPKVRLPGSGGACEIAALAKRVVITIANSKRTLPERVDFVTSPGYLRGWRERESLGLSGGPELVITDMGVYRFDPTTREMVLVSVHPGVTLATIKDNIGWDVKVANDL